MRNDKPCGDNCPLDECSPSCPSYSPAPSASGEKVTYGEHPIGGCDPYGNHEIEELQEALITAERERDELHGQIHRLFGFINTVGCEIGLLTAGMDDCELKTSLQAISEQARQEQERYTDPFWPEEIKVERQLREAEANRRQIAERVADSLRGKLAEAEGAAAVRLEAMKSVAKDMQRNCDCCSLQHTEDCELEEEPCYTKSAIETIRVALSSDVRKKVKSSVKG